MNCRQVGRLMSAYVDGELTGVEMLELRRHIGECPGCRDEFESIRATKVLVSRLCVVEPPLGFMNALSARLDEIQVPVYQRMWNSLAGSVRERVTPVTTAFVAVSVALMFLSARSIDQINHPVQTDAVAQMPSVEMPPVNSMHPKFLTFKQEPYYSSPVSVSSARGVFIPVSFRP